MEAIWFLVFCLVSATAPNSLAQLLPEIGLPPMQSDILILKLHHVRGPGSSLAPVSPSVIDALSLDEERVKSIHQRLTNKSPSGASSSSKRSGGPKSISIPTNPGFSLSSGDYYVKIGLGTPVKYYSLFLDTGSSFSWLQCKPCARYCHPQVDPLFDPSKSQTYKSLACTTSQCAALTGATHFKPYCASSSNACVYTSKYGDNSSSVGFLSQDSLTLSKYEALPDFIYGCGQNNKGLFGFGAGLMGLARAKLSMTAQLSSKYGYAFTYCLPTPDHGIGFLSIGNSSMGAVSSYKFTNMLRDTVNPSLYFLRLAAITVAGTPLGVGAAHYRVPTIIDSGTVMSRLPLSVYTALRETFVKIMSKKYKQVPGNSVLDTCFSGSLENSSFVPPVRMIFQGGADLKLKTPNVVIEAMPGVSCLAFRSSSPQSPIAIIGNRQQQTFKITYDIYRSKIGFAAGGCG